MSYAVSYTVAPARTLLAAANSFILIEPINSTASSTTHCSNSRNTVAYPSQAPHNIRADESLCSGCPHYRKRCVSGSSLLPLSVTSLHRDQRTPKLWRISHPRLVSPDPSSSNLDPAQRHRVVSRALPPSRALALDSPFSNLPQSTVNVRPPFLLTNPALLIRCLLFSQQHALW